MWSSEGEAKHNGKKDWLFQWLKQPEETVVMKSLEANCISKLSSNHTLQLTTLRIHVSVRESLYTAIHQKCDAFVVTLTNVQWLNNIVFVRWSGKRPSWFSYTKCTTCNHWMSLSATRVTTEWLKQPISLFLQCMARATGKYVHCSYSHIYRSFPLKQGWLRTHIRGHWRAQRSVCSWMVQ